MSSPRWKIILAWLVPIVLFLILAFDGNTHWDESNYLYKGAFPEFGLNVQWVHSCGGFYSGRMFHILILRGLFALTGVGLIPLLVVRTVMAVFVLGTAWLFSRMLKVLDLAPPLAYLGAVSFLFLPLSLYLGYKALGETTALLMVAFSLYLFFVGLKQKASGGIITPLVSGGVLFLATNARVESLLTFTAVVIPYICFSPGRRTSALRALAGAGISWLILTAALGLSTGFWCLEFFLRRSADYGTRFAADNLTYPSNWIVALLFGGGLWFFALISLAGLRRREVKIAWAGLLLSMVPIAILADHTELRYYNPAVFSFALAVALGLKIFYDWLGRKQGLKTAGVITTVLFLVVVTGNQMARSIQDVGTHGLQLIRLISRVQEEYPDPLLLTAHPHSTYSFLRMCYPEMRIALDRDFEGLAPLKVKGGEELAKLEGPWLYLSSRGPKERPLLMNIYHHLKGVVPEEQDGPPVIVTNWVADSQNLLLRPLDREGRYLVFELSLAWE